MAATAWIIGLALAALAGRLVLWTTLRGPGPRASTLEAVRDALGTVEYEVAPLDLACRGHVVVRHDDPGAPGAALLCRFRGLEPQDVVALLRAEGFRADLVPEGESFGPSFLSRWGRLAAFRMNALRERLRRSPRHLRASCRGHGADPRLGDRSASVRATL